MNHSLAARTKEDRRRNDYGPPKGWKERRRTAERRRPEIEECIVSESEWMFYFGQKTMQTANGAIHVTETEMVQVEISSEVFARVRD